MQNINLPNYYSILYPRARAVTVHLGAHDILNARERGQVRINVTPSSFIIHQGWNPNTVRNDIALIKMVRPIVYNGKWKSDKF